MADNNAANPQVRPAQPVYETVDAPPSFSQAAQAAAAQSVPMPTDFNPFAGSGQAPPQPPPAAPAPQQFVAPSQPAPVQAPQQPQFQQQASPQGLTSQQPAPVQPPQPVSPQPMVLDPGPATDVLPPWATMQQIAGQRVAQPAQPGQQPPGSPAVSPDQQQQPAVPGAPPAPIDLGDYLQEKGIDLAQIAGESDNPRQALDYLVDQAQLARQYQIQLQQYQAAYQQAMAQQQQSQTPAPAAPGAPSQPAAPALDASAPPELDVVSRQWLDAIRDGRLTDEQRQQMPVNVYAQLARYDQWEKARAEQLVRDPMAILWPALEAKLKEHFVPKDAMEQALQQRDQGQFERALNIHHEPDWYEHDVAGNRMMDPATGQPRLTPWGVKWAEQQSFFQQAGISDPVMLAQAIERAIGPPPSSAPPQQQPPAQQQPTVQAPSPNGNGVAAPPAPQPYPMQPQATPQQAFVDQAALMHAQYPGYPPAQRGGVYGQPTMSLGPDDLAPPRFSDVARELQGAPTPW